MDASELRIGNLLRDKVSKTELKVIKLTEKDIVTYVIDRSRFPLQSGWALEPILLTEEWLLKFGFWHDNYYNSSKRFINKSPLIIIQGNGYYTLPYYFHCEIKYVHQLQNLYFALTNHELTLD